jgi:hypothetical protein
MPGILTNGLTAYTGAQLATTMMIPIDTQLPSGREPQTVAATLASLRDLLLGGTASGTATATAGAATLNAGRGKITTEALTTAAAASYTLTLTNSAIAAADIVLVSVANGTNTQGITVVQSVTPAAGSVVILINNQHAAQALNGTLVISFVVVKA